ncbi:thiosulfate/3-mercaptopyruvate sulfurtransferase [Rhizobium sp. BIGb0125]|jgi:thiosulfate/3-mercaptopyruvate sulfurtransferase|uniref:sulfurtransferase n=1 Tax=Rhizobium sp. BIGb0125 TaxID=2940618 RepID=UPI0021696C82|nr:rhodanese-like domain-containing protein [Rhizobium sp. BIGb0125]MCS4244091.1 thiosulfate/3-mercaptopyruvate sulfurtransferase [Rhizobium sp. BIGb0125]
MTELSSTFSNNIISVEEALNRVASGNHVVFLDVRFSPKQQDLRSDYDAEHIEGAHYVDLKTQLQGKGGGLAGSRPLPEPSELQKNLELWGISPDTTVVVYTKSTPAAAARAWFVLRWAGVSNVRFLNGGLSAWKAAGGRTGTGSPATGGGTLVIDAVDHLPTLSADEIAVYILAGRKVFDARGADGFAGDGSARSGHIPGARNLPATRFIGSDGLLLNEVEIHKTLAAFGGDSSEAIGVYCGGGVGGALETLALRSAGIDAKLFVGSFSAWSADPSRKVAQGNE